MTDKKQLRAEMRRAREAFVAAAPRALAVPAALRAMFRADMIVAAYVPIGSEADPAPLVAAARVAGCRVALPHVVDRQTALTFLPWDENAALVDGPFRLRQPAGDACPIAPELVLTPLIAFDRALNRVGQGAGHYDRAFAQYPHAKRIGVAWSVQEVARIDADPWDAPLDAIVTEQEWITR
ncbi:5-formyltetrahydrofolate cyclo-ligase [Sphingomonas palmae]|uniref:5-formyltetrahydrofolate cyclo-ligase n=1 Tax=Sphingomonas palmae TaxID=1855283 RepID=A0A1H7IU84_9SPHN|nr:5-formyltetrahydrofolate cyclo-ligase [Sphingomonas palmae]SEK64345.1 5-formyltetrahydrofolate cyclo-ligase [Sphingomonas palmae]